MPFVEAMKIHIASFPNALREMRRSDAETQKAVAELATRLHTLEQRSTAYLPPPDPLRTAECLCAK
jgi:hypothetical protein